VISQEVIADPVGVIAGLVAGRDLPSTAR